MSIVSGTTFAYSLRTPVDEEALAALRDAVTAAAQAGAKRCVVAIDVESAAEPLAETATRIGGTALALWIVESESCSNPPCN